MAIATVPITFARGIVAVAGTSVQPVAADGATPAPVPDNCYSILITNPSTTVVGLVGIGAPPTSLTAGVNAQRVPPSSTVTLGVGTRFRRGIIDQTQVAGSGLIFDASAALTLEVTYLNLMGSPG